MPPTRSKVLLAFAAVYVFWGSTYLAIKIALETLPPFLMAGSRFVAAGLVLMAFARIRGTPAPTARHWLSAAVVGGLLLLGGNGGVVWAQQTVPSGLAALIVASVPLLMAVLDALRPGGARPGPAAVLGLIGGFAGVALLVLSGGAGSGQVNPAAAAALLGASLSWAVGSLLAKTLPLPAPLLAIGMEMIAGGMLQILAGLGLGEAARLDLAAVSARSWSAVAYLVVFGSLGGFVSYVWLLGVRPAAQVATYAYVNPVIAVVLGWALAGEPLSGSALAAAVLIVGSVGLVTAAPPRPRPAVATP
ncbi:MAG TPA: EamA family transporter [Planctomycetota bacterium]|nr:EamA family transporter [Planctomycetota bacterium]